MWVQTHFTLTVMQLKHVQRFHISPHSFSFLVDIKRCPSSSTWKKLMSFWELIPPRTTSANGVREWIGGCFSQSVPRWTVHCKPTSEDLGGNELQPALVVTLVTSIALLYWLFLYLPLPGPSLLLCGFQSCLCLRLYFQEPDSWIINYPLTLLFVFFLFSGDLSLILISFVELHLETVFTSILGWTQ